LRILQVSAYYAPAFVYGGPPRSIHGLCKALHGHGARVQVFTTDANGMSALPPEVSARRDYDGVPVRYFPHSWPATPIGSRELTLALRPALEQIDLVHVHGLWNRVVWAAARAARSAGVPYVLSPRGMLQDGALAHRPWRKRLAYALIERHTIAGASLLHATSEAERDALATIAPSIPVRLIPNGIDVDAPRAALTRHELEVPSAGPLISFVGRIHQIKRLDLLLDAFARLVPRHPDARLVIAGPDEQGLRPGLESRHPNLAPHTTWLGNIDTAQRDALLAHSHALVLCSDSESFGMTVVEAMAVARPVVVTSTCGWNDVQRHGAGLQVPQTPVAIADALARLLDDHALARRMGLRGRALASTTYSWNAVRDAFLSAYRSVLDGRSPQRVAS
jgi:glycosyltransferase involved in cell wall biosynthesis